MSSATSIEQQVRVKPDATRGDRPAKKTSTEAAGGRPWHFFVLLSLVAATVAVVLSRQATPEHLIVISITMAAAGVAAAALYRMLAPLVVRDVSTFNEPLTERARSAFEREKTLVLRSIKELEFDRAMRKLSAKDFDEMSGRLRARALLLMKQLDEGSGYRAEIERELRERMKVRLKPDTTARGVRLQADPDVWPEPASACACGTVNDDDAIFCKRCGAKLTLVSAADDPDSSE
jgi:hypothetical protein